MWEEYKKNIKNSSRIGVLILLLVFISNVTGQTTASSFLREDFQSKSGPLWVKNELVKSAVFSAPDFEFTDEFKEHQKFPNIRGMFFNGLPFKGKPTKVFCWYGKPDGLKEGEKRPAVVLVHGGGGTAFPEWVKEWTDRGYIAISIALEGQIPGEKNQNIDGDKFWPTFDYSGPRRTGFFEDVVSEKLQNQWFYHAVADVILANSLLKSFSEVDDTKIGITGISWGGILTNVITGIDNRFAFAIPVYGCGFLHETPHYNNLLSKLSQEKQTFYLNNWEPSLYVPFQEQPTLFVNGNKDFHFTMNSFTKTYETSRAKKHLYIEHNMKHGHRPGWIPKTIYAFADYIVKKGKEPIIPEFMGLDEKNELQYRCNTKIDKAFLYYTSNTADWGRDNYSWSESGVQLSDSGKVISATLPKEAVAYYINVIDSDGIIMYSSPMRTVKNKG